jgi:arylsulfatase A-like enzyme
MTASGRSTRRSRTSRSSSRCAGLPQEGRSVRGLLAQPVDILPTLLDLTGLDVTPPEPFHGKSFAAGAARRRRKSPLHDVAICGSFLRQAAMAPGARTTAVTPGRSTPRSVGVRALRTRQTGASSFDLRQDPGATKRTSSPVITRASPDDLHAQLVAWLRALDAPDEALAVFIS